MNDPNDFFVEKWDKIDHRYYLIVQWLIHFINYSKEHLSRDLAIRDDKSIEEMALIINTAYWIRYQKVFKNFVKSRDGGDSNIRMNKIISGLELTIIDQRPFKAEDNSAGALLNAEFALFVSLNLMITWYSFEPTHYNELVKKDEEIQHFLEDHKTWLINLQPEFEYPVYLNSQVWALYIKLIKSLIVR